VGDLFQTLRCGLIPLVECRDVTTSGFRWNVSSETLVFGKLVSTSNEFEKGAQVAEAFGDFTEAEAPARLVAETVAALGGLDVLVANAGFADRTPIATLTDAGFAKSHEAITFSFLRLARAAAPHLAAGQDPRLIAVSSFVAHLFRNDVTTFPASAAAKAAVEALVRALAIEW